MMQTTGVPTAIFMGSKPGAAVALTMLLRRGWVVRRAVVTRRPYQPWTAGDRIEHVARQHGIPVGPQSELPRDERVDFVISYMYRNLVREDVLALARVAALNFHAAPLPDFGGFGCYNRAVLDRCESFGATCHYMDADFDTGDILRVRRFPIEADRETALSVERKAQEEMLRLFADVCDLAESGAPLPRLPQDPAKRRYLHEADLEALKRIPAGADAETVERYARAFWYPPYRGAVLDVGGIAVEVIPETVKQELAALLHQNDHARLAAVAEHRNARRRAA